MLQDSPVAHSLFYILLRKTEDCFTNRNLGGGVGGGAQRQQLGSSTLLISRSNDPTLDVHAVSTCPQLPSNLIVMEVGAYVNETREDLHGATSGKYFYPPQGVVPHPPSFLKASLLTTSESYQFQNRTKIFEGAF